MRRITALPLGIALVGLLAGAPAAGTSVEDDHTAAMMVAVADAGAAPTPSLIADAAPARAIAADVEGEVSIDDLTSLTPDASFDATSVLLRGDILYDLDAGPTDGRHAVATPLDGIAAFAQGLVIGLNEADLADVRVSN